MVHVTLDNQFEKFDYKVPVERDNIIKISFNVFIKLCKTKHTWSFKSDIFLPTFSPTDIKSNFDS